VWRVKNYLRVRPVDPVADTTIVERVKGALACNSLVDSSEITVTAHDGLVMLTGAVDSYVEKSEAEDVAMRTTGVVAVTNYLTVRNPRLTSYAWDYQPFYRAEPDASLWTYRSDAEIEEDIEDELFWSPFVDSDDVKVSVSHGVATLTGTVDSWFEYRSAGVKAIEGGAVTVINNLTVVINDLSVG
jgi:osmotically-inducible protein OsmY